MPITKSAKKALRGSKTKKMVNDRRKKQLKESIKNFEKLLKANKKEEAQKMLPELYKAIDKSAKGGIIKKNNASSKNSRLTKKTK
jgi:small subunit ribosomal protein S20